MSKIFLIFFLIFLTSCATTIEPTSQKNNPAKVSDEIKIAYSSPQELIIMFKLSPISFNYAGYIPPSYEFIETAFNHCSMYKKNTYYLYAYVNSKYTHYDWRAYRIKDKIYTGYRFICAESQGVAKLYKDSSAVSFNSFWDQQVFYRHSALAVFEKKRILSEQEIAENKKKELEEKARIAKLEKQRRVALIESLENEYGNVCLKNENNNKFLKGTIDYENCLIAHDEKIIAQKREADELRKQKQRELEEKLAKMSPTERHAYNCTETFNFKKGSEKFNDCVFELYTAELDIQKLELEKQVAEANAKAASNEQLRAEALAKAQIAAANASTRAANLNSSMQLMKLSEQLIRGNQQQNPFNQNNARLRTTCSNVGGFLTCF